jgi:hypothetical protein
VSFLMLVVDSKMSNDLSGHCLAIVLLSNIDANTFSSQWPNRNGGNDDTMDHLCSAPCNALRVDNG